jgi:phosphatidylserine/phosphatidylglycerophosphate/cardiolipin synthase-like enzyme
MVKNSLLLIVVSLLSIQLFSQQSIEDARRIGLDETVTVSGIVTNGGELGIIRYIQDGTAGIAAYSDLTSDLEPGDSVTVTGSLKDYNNLLEIDPVETVTVHSTGNPLPAPKILNIPEIGEDYESQLVRINDVSFSNPTGTFEGDANYEIISEGETIEIRINRNATGIVGEPIPTESFDLIAIVSQYSWRDNDVTSGYQLLPRTMQDFDFNSNVMVTSAVNVSNINKTGFTLYWETDAEGTAEVRYGTNITPGAWTRFAAGTTSQAEEIFLQETEITGLTSGSIIYAQPFSVLGNDTAFAPVAAYATESNSTGEIKAYFNTDVDHSVATGTLAKNIGTAMDDTLIAYINRATETIDFAIYNINNSGLSNVSEALNEAHDRGVRIRFITCESTQHAGTDDLNPAIPVLERPEIPEGGIMHNKFAVFDAESADASKPVVWSGSTNLTYDQVRTDANNMIFIQDQSLAKAYQIEFEEMWGGTGETPNESNAKFGENKTDNTPHEFIIDGHLVELYFSPSDGTNQQLIDAIHQANNNLNVATMLITRTDLAVAISDAKNEGVAVNVLTDYEGSNTQTVNDILLEELGPNNFIFDDEVADILHHKYAVIDNSKPEFDPVVITGSHNWSNSANIRNDENTLIIHNGDIANQYYQNFVARFKGNNGDLATQIERFEETGILVYPNPATNRLNISSPKNISRIGIYSLTGVKAIDIQPKDTPSLSIELKGLKPGLYLLKIQTNNMESEIFKFLKN